MKKSSTILAVILAAGLTVTAAGCSSSGKNSAVLSSNWYSDVTYKSFQRSVCESTEKIVYKVTHEPLEDAYANTTYSLSYGEGGTYTTEFGARLFHAKEYDYPEAYETDYNKKGTFMAYCYTTELVIPTITYTLKSEVKPFDGSTFEDDLYATHVTTECWFLSVADNLQPVYSKQVVKCVTPWSLKPKKLEKNDAFKTFDLVYENFYSLDGKAVTTRVTDNDPDGDEADSEYTNEKLNKVKNSLFDTNAQDIVVRASDLYSGSNLSQAVSYYIPTSGKTENFLLTGVSTALQVDDELLEELKDNGLYEVEEPAEGDDETDGSETTVNLLQTVAVTVSYTSGSQPGGSQVYWFAPVSDKHGNLGKATMLQLSTPLPYYLGTLSYTLDKIDSTFSR